MMFLKKISLILLMSIIFLGNVVPVKSEFGCDIKNLSGEYFKCFNDFVLTHKDAFIIGGLAVFIISCIPFLAREIKHRMEARKKACRNFVVKFLEAKEGDTSDEKKIDELVNVTQDLFHLYSCSKHS